jgi:NAD(P)H-dependent flavin oxidoreductase YrpB (nitropropane dioxygenase family)
MKERMFESKSEDAVVSKALTGKNCRILRSNYTEAWDKAETLKPLTFPLQSILGGVPLRRAERVRRFDYWTYAVGQVVGDMNQETTVRQIFAEMLGEYVEVMEHLNNLLED